MSSLVGLAGGLRLREAREEGARIRAPSQLSLGEDELKMGVAFESAGLGKRALG